MSLSNDYKTHNKAIIDWGLNSDEVNDCEGGLNMRWHERGISMLGFYQILWNSTEV